jgi:hypothetical protein
MCLRSPERIRCGIHACAGHIRRLDGRGNPSPALSSDGEPEAGTHPTQRKPGETVLGSPSRGDKTIVSRTSRRGGAGEAVADGPPGVGVGGQVDDDRGEVALVEGVERSVEHGCVGVGLGGHRHDHEIT